MPHPKPMLPKHLALTLHWLAHINPLSTTLLMFAISVFT